MKLNWILFLTLLLAFVDSEELEEKKKIRTEGNIVGRKLRGETHPEEINLRGAKNQQEQKFKAQGSTEEKKLGEEAEDKKFTEEEIQEEGNPGDGSPEENKLRGEGNSEQGSTEKNLSGKWNPEESKFGESNPENKQPTGEDTPEKSKSREKGNSEQQKLTQNGNPEELNPGNTEINKGKIVRNSKERLEGTRIPKARKLRRKGKPRGETIPDESKQREKQNTEASKLGLKENAQEKTLRKDDNLNNPEVKNLTLEGNIDGKKLRKEGNKAEGKFYNIPEQGNSDKSKQAEAGKPNIVFIVADDLGWNDVSFHGSDQIQTPNIDTLAYQGIILEQYYTDTLGTASRSALFTGKYPSRLGTQSVSIQASEDRGIPVGEKLLPEYLKQLGYTTHLLGKWHVGKSRQIYLPTNRGFDSFYGFLGGSVDYYTYNLIENNIKNTTSSFYGLDFFENLKPVEGLNGHLTDILTDRAVEVIRTHNKSSPLYLHLSHAAPHTGGALVSLEAPVEFIAANQHIAHSARRHYAGLVTGLDKSVGRVVAALAEREMLQNTIIIFVSDNGAPTAENFGSNLPLRGTKDTPWEGGARSIALLWNPSLTGGIWSGLFHVTDWMPTLVTAAGGNVNETIDGVNQWTALTTGGQPRRNEILVTIDDVKGWAAFREGDFKIIVGELQNETSRYQELQALRNEPPAYERALLESESWRVLKETTDIVLDVDSALAKRNRSNLLVGTIPVQDVVPCVPTRAKGCLYNISEDPLEAHDLWAEAPEIVKRMALRLRSLWAELKPRGNPKQDLRADPTKHDYVWTPWVADDEPIENSSSVPPFPLAVSMGELQYLVDLNLNIFRQRTFDAIKTMGSSFLKSVGGLFNF